MFWIRQTVFPAKPCLVTSRLTRSGELSVNHRCPITRIRAVMVVARVEKAMMRKEPHQRYVVAFNFKMSSTYSATGKNTCQFSFRYSCRKRSSFEQCSLQAPLQTLYFHFRYRRVEVTVWLYSHSVTIFSLSLSILEDTAILLCHISSHHR